MTLPVFTEFRLFLSRSTVLVNAATMDISFLEGGRSQLSIAKRGRLPGGVRNRNRELQIANPRSRASDLFHYLFSAFISLFAIIGDCGQKDMCHDSQIPST